MMKFCFLTILSLFQVLLITGCGGGSSPSQQAAQKPFPEPEPIVKLEDTCLKRSCGDNWLFQLTLDNLMQIDRNAADLEGALSKLTEAARTVAASGKLIVEIKRVTADRVETGKWNENVKAQNAYLWLFEQIYRENGQRRSDTKPDKIFAAIEAFSRS